MGELAFKNNANHSNNLQPMSTNNNHDSKIIQFPVNHSNNFQSMSTNNNHDSKIIQFPVNHSNNFQSMSTNNNHDSKIIQFPVDHSNNLQSMSTNNNRDSKIIQFPSEQTDMTVSDWIQLHHSEDELRGIFLNMDIAMKYLHDHGFCVEIFHPLKIFVLNGMADHIKFSAVPLPTDYSAKEEAINKDIFNSALVQIGIYTKLLDRITPEFLKENFDDISILIPEDFVPYYRGVVQRNAKVYLSEYTVEKGRRDLETLENELNVPDSDRVVQFPAQELEHNAINGKIYAYLTKREAAKPSTV